MTADPAAPSFRFRVTQHLAGLRARDLAPEIVPLPRRPWARWRALRALPPGSVVLVHAVFLTRGELAHLQQIGARLLYDFDDAVTERDPLRPGLPAIVQRRRFARIVSAADTVLAGQPDLADFARPWARGPVQVIPTTVDPGGHDAFTARNAATAAAHETRQAGPRLVVGWLGVGANPADLEDLAPALRELTRRHASFRVRAIGNTLPRLHDVALEHRPWSLVREGAEIAELDVGIAPRRDDARGRGRCGSQVLQLQAACRPVICSPVGIHRELVIDGESGWFARDTGEWIDRLDRLLRSAEERARLGRAGRRRLEDRLPLAEITDQLAAALRG